MCVFPGMAVDYVQRQLIYTNIGSLQVDGIKYSWHKVESVNIDGLQRNIKTIVSSIADKPRAVAIDIKNA